MYLFYKTGTFPGRGRAGKDGELPGRKPDRFRAFHFSIVWKNGPEFFHGVENVFPQCGKFRQSVSMVWKISVQVFHGMENDRI
jgi:hypothetical protein